MQENLLLKQWTICVCVHSSIDKPVLFHHTQHASSIGCFSAQCFGQDIVCLSLTSTWWKRGGSHHYSWKSQIVGGQHCLQRDNDNIYSSLEDFPNFFVFVRKIHFNIYNHNSTWVHFFETEISDIGFYNFHWIIPISGPFYKKFNPTDPSCCWTHTVCLQVHIISVLTTTCIL